jgi:ATP phosphoribosyltransferase regulatory subunit HisZ
VPALAPITPSAVLRHDSSPRDGTSMCPSSVRSLLEQARQGLLDAEYAVRPIDRYAQAHRAALRAAAAVLAARARPRRRGQSASAWVLLISAAPELEEWSRLFAASSATRAAAEAGVVSLVTERDADELVRQVGQFLALARQAARTSR